MKETYERVDAPPEIKTNKKDKKLKQQQKEEKKKPKESDKNIDLEYRELLELKKDLSKKLETSKESSKENKIIKRAIKECRESIHTLIKDARKKNTKDYKTLIHSDENKPNEFTYFRTKLSNSEQMKVMRDLKEVNSHIHIEKPYRLALLESSMPSKCKAIAMQKLNVLKQMDPGEHEYYKIKNWVDAFMKIPFGVHKSLSVKMTDGVDACHTFMKDAKKTLDECVYGLDDAKLQIMQMLGQWITNPEAMGTAIAIKGPPGTGKTTLVKDGISKILGREFIFIPLGGTGDASFLEGHSYTYEGSMWGKIVQTLIQCGSMNPVFFFDELDKLSDTPKGEEIVGILTHLTDTTQNSQFHDKYFSEVDFDLSKCLFIFSYNDESKINPILKDRMYRIETKGYDSKEKLIIARNYMLPKIREQVNFAEGDIVLPDDTIKYIISTKHLTHEEAGVRNMKRCLEIIHTKLNLFRLVKPEDNLFTKEIAMQVEFPYTVLKNHVDVLIKNEEKQSQSLLAMYC
jgi:ATP-dependent Lon protease